MVLLKGEELSYYQCEIFENTFTHAFFTRHGGISPDPWKSLNFGGTVGDLANNVQENKRRALSALKLNPDYVFDVWQVHGTNVVISESPRDIKTPHYQADAILTDTHGIVLMMRFADCVPVLLHDPVKNVAGIVHAGWMGTVRGVLPATIQAMHSRFGSRSGDIIAAIGPSIGPDHYTIGRDVEDRVRDAFGSDSSGLLFHDGEKLYFNLWAANRLALERCGVTHIEITGICTACNLKDWYSHRAENGRTGRFGAVVSIG